MTYLTTSHITRARSETTEVIEEGVYIDRRHPNLREEYAVLSSTGLSPERRDAARLEEARYAARSGPVVIVRPAQK